MNRSVSKSQYNLLKRLLPGTYAPPPRPETHDNATWRALARKGLIVDVDGVWTATSLAKEIVVNRGLHRATPAEEHS